MSKPCRVDFIGTVMTLPKHDRVLEVVTTADEHGIYSTTLHRFRVPVAEGMTIKELLNSIDQLSRVIREKYKTHLSNVEDINTMTADKDRPWL